MLGEGEDEEEELVDPEDQTWQQDFTTSTTAEVADKKLSASMQKILEERYNMVIAHFLFSVVWSIGGALEGTSRLKFDEFFRSLCDMEGDKAKYPRSVVCISCSTCFFANCLKYEHLVLRFRNAFNYYYYF